MVISGSLRKGPEGHNPRPPGPMVAKKGLHLRKKIKTVKDKGS